MPAIVQFWSARDRDGMADSRAHVLYYAPTVCSLAPHIVLRELEISFELVRVDLRSHTTAAGTPLAEVTRKDYVPALALPDGSILTETQVMLLYLADLAPDRGLAPPAGSLARLRLHELLAFIATELHKGFAPFTIMASPSDASKQWASARLARRVAVLDEVLGDRAHFVGDTLGVADIYVYWALGAYERLTRGELSPRLRALVERVGQRPSVEAARAAERIA